MENLATWADLQILACFEGEISRKKIIQAKHDMYQEKKIPGLFLLGINIKPGE